MNALTVKLAMASIILTSYAASAQKRDSVEQARTDTIMIKPILIGTGARMPANGRAETEEEEIAHLSFKGIPIDGSKQSYIGMLKGKGMTEGDDGLLHGEFAGYRTTIEVDGTPTSVTTYRVIAKTETKKTWKDIINDYETFRRNLMFKYDNPAHEENKFSMPYKEGDGYERRAFDNDKARWRCAWSMNEGDIVMDIRTNENGFYLLITYTDAWGLSRLVKEKTIVFMQDL